MNNRRKKPFKIKGQQYEVYYGNDKYVWLVCVLIVVLLGCIGTIILSTDSFSVIYLLHMVVTIPLILGIIYAFRFRIKFIDNVKQLEVQKLFGGYQKIYLDDIVKIYKSRDRRTTFLNIHTVNQRIHINMISCENTGPLEAYLRTYKRDCFIKSEKKEFHLL